MCVYIYIYTYIALYILFYEIDINHNYYNYKYTIIDIINYDNALLLIINMTYIDNFSISFSLIMPIIVIG